MNQPIVFSKNSFNKDFKPTYEELKDRYKGILSDDEIEQYAKELNVAPAKPAAANKLSRDNQA